MNRHHNHLHSADETSRCLVLHVVFLIPAGAREEDSDQHEHHNPDLEHTLCDTQIEGAHLTAVSHTLVDLPVVLFAEEEAIGQTVSRTEMPLTGILTTDDDRQRNAQMLSLVRGDVPLIRVGQVFKNNLRNIDLLTSITFFGHSWHRQQRYHHQENYRL